MQEDKGIQAFTVRVPDELYGRVKAYAETHGESLSEITGKALEMFLTGVQPSPEPEPAPGPGPAIPAELLELPGKVREILAVMFSVAPVPPWGILSAVEQVRRLAELAQGH